MSQQPLKRMDRVRQRGSKEEMVILSGPDEDGYYECQRSGKPPVRVAAVDLERVKVKVSATWLGKK